MSRERLETRIGKRLRERGQSLATGESCTGGLLGHRITNVPGASEYYRGGIVAYSNEAKVALLGVERTALARFGAVSEAVARQMAEGVRRRLDADWGIGVTGIAGPAGGTPDKPLGLVYIAVAGQGRVTVRCSRFAGARAAIKKQTAEEALRLFWEQLG